jgi:hypothetical protein
LKLSLTFTFYILYLVKMPSYAALAAAAIKGLAERGGSSLASIKKFIASKNGDKGVSAVS